MPTATIVAAWQDQAGAHIAIRVGDVEYIGTVPADSLAGLSKLQQKAALVAAVKAVRDAQLAAATALGITGSVTV